MAFLIEALVCPGDQLLHEPRRIEWTGGLKDDAEMFANRPADMTKPESSSAGRPKKAQRLNRFRETAKTWPSQRGLDASANPQVWQAHE